MARLTHLGSDRPRPCENVRAQRMRRIVFSLVPPSTATATAVLFLFNVIETKFLRASSTSESSHSLDPKPTLGLAFRSGSSLCLAHRSRRTYDWRMPICHRAFNERGESGIRNILKPATSGNPSAASADTKASTAAGTSPLINRLIAFV